MNRGLKNRTPISNAIDTKLYEDLKKLSANTMIPISRLLDRAIELVLKEYEKTTLNKEWLDESFLYFKRCGY